MQKTSVGGNFLVCKFFSAEGISSVNVFFSLNFFIFRLKLYN